MSNNRGGKETLGKIQERVEGHGKYRKSCLNLIASENSVSPAALEVMGSDLANRYTVSGKLDPEKRFFPGLGEFYNGLEASAIEMARNALGAEYVTLHPISGMMANMVAYYALINPGETVFTVREKHGGHYSHRKGNDDKDLAQAQTMLDFYRAKVDYLPFDDKEYDLDYDAIEMMMTEAKDKPKLLVVGASEMLFPIKLRKLRDICDRCGNGTKILYDAAHVAGLIFGGRFQKPLEEGADMFATSTNKSLGGVDHGLVAWNDPAYNARVEYALVPLFTSNHHAQEVASVAVTLAENVDFGEEYADQVIRNSRALGLALDSNGVIMVASHRGYSESHMVLANIGDHASKVKDALEKANIILNTCHLPKDEDETETGLRIGTGEMTRMGMTEDVMTYVGELMARVINNYKDETVAEEVKVKVKELTSLYQDQKYCYQPVAK